jgi:arsenate reductase
MAEGLLRRLSQDTLEVHSGGTHPSTVNQLAIEAMREVGIDISGHRSKSVAEFVGCHFDTVITVCDRAAEHCPVFPGAPERIHWSLPDPAGMIGTHQERLAAFRNVRNDLQRRLRAFLQTRGADAFPL